jgi:orotate phosphoribosyltransferase
LDSNSAAASGFQGTPVKAADNGTASNSAGDARMERSGNAVEIGEKSAVQAVEQEFGLPVIAIANLADLMSFLTASSDTELSNYLPAVKTYRDTYGI